ncbi:hypothetical protein RJT34_00419 [Clitoria ternatea]|uniref:Uncharacterized protein n=1 Tax=Clitoria ternatea TaxID=43366 RepID=A0AAN9KIA5_CLITE
MEVAKDGEEVVIVGTTGTISSLMTRELDQISSDQTQPAPSTCKPRVSVSSGSTTLKQQPRKSFDEAGSSRSRSRSSNIINHRGSGIGLKTNLNGKHVHQVPMLGSHNNIPLETSPARKKNGKKKRSSIVEVVDLKCGYPDKAWATPITNSLKKLGFSKLSESMT